MQFSKIISPVLLILFSLSFMPVSASAADLGFSTGGGVWKSEASGSMRYEDNPTVDVDDLDYDKENRGYIWAELRHPVPYLPNLRIEYVDLKFSGSSNESFVWGDTTFKGDAYSETNLSQLDMIVFYNIFSQPWVDFDLGVDVKYLDFEFYAEGEGRDLENPLEVVTHTEHEEETLFVPFIYSKVRLNIPTTNFGIEGDVKYVKYKSTSILDTSIKADYLFDFKAAKFGIEVGYRFESVDIDRDDFNSIDFDVDVEIKGLFAGLVFKY